MWLLTVEWDTTSRPYCSWAAPSCLRCWLWKGRHPHCHTLWWKGMHPHVYTVDCGKGDTLTATPSGGGRNAPSRLHFWLWKGRHPHSHSLWWLKEMHPHVYTVDGGKGDTLTATPSGGGKECTLTSTLLTDCGKDCALTSTLLTVERETPLTAKPSGGGKDCTLTSTVHCWLWKGILLLFSYTAILSRQLELDRVPPANFWPWFRNKGSAINCLEIEGILIHWFLEEWSSCTFSSK